MPGAGPTLPDCPQPSAGAGSRSLPGLRLEAAAAVRARAAL